MYLGMAMPFLGDFQKPSIRKVPIKMAQQKCVFYPGIGVYEDHHQAPKSGHQPSPRRPSTEVPPKLAPAGAKLDRRFS